MIVYQADGAATLSRKNIAAQWNVTEGLHALAEGGDPEVLMACVRRSAASADCPLALKQHRVDRAAVGSLPRRRAVEPTAKQQREHKQHQSGAHADPACQNAFAIILARRYHSRQSLSHIIPTRQAPL